MANISTYLQKILDAIYGEEVRGSIHDALAAMNTEASSAMEYAKTAKDSASASAEKAKGEADTATKKAAEALDSAERAETSEVNVQAAELRTKQYSDEAVDAAARAKDSETNAANSEATATQKALEAEESKNAAALSEAEAKAAEERARTIRSDVETLGAQAAADKNAAEAARLAAENAKEAALDSQNEAKRSENAALAAKTAAEIALTDTEAAKAAAEAAKTDAEAAAQSASEDADDAGQAAKDAAASALSAQQYSGKPPKPQDGTWWIWNAETGQYEDTGIGCELVGPQGVSILDIALASGDHTPGTSDVYTIYLSDGSTKTISVYNGRNGTGAGDVLGISFDLVLPVSGWADGALMVADERLLASATHKYFIGADNASKEEFIDCGVQPQDITTNGAIVFTNQEDPTMDLTVHVVRFELGANGA